MTGIVSRIQWLMIVSGVLTFIMVFAAVAPEAALRSTLGASLDGPVSIVVDGVMILLFACWFLGCRGTPERA